MSVLDECIIRQKIKYYKHLITRLFPVNMPISNMLIGIETATWTLYKAGATLRMQLKVSH
jgi:hypothetical protein